MGRPLEDVVASLPPDRQKRIEARVERMREDVESLGQLRGIAGKAQAEIAATLNIKQPTVSKIEKQADMYLSTLKSYVEALGGQLDLVVRLPSREPLRIARLGDIVGMKEPATPTAKVAPGRRPRPGPRALAESRKA